MRLRGIKVLLSVFAVVMIFPMFANAGEVFITPKIGTLGFGADLGYQISDTYKVRANGNYFKLSRDDSVKTSPQKVPSRQALLELVRGVNSWDPPD